MMSRWKSIVKSILSDPIVRKLTFFTRLRFASGCPNAALISIVLIKNGLAALWNVQSVWASNREIKLYRETLRDLASQDTRQNVKLLHLIYGLKQDEPIHYFHWAL